MSHRVAVVLAGCGAKDGAEITEAVSLLIALSQHGFSIQCYAPDRPQYHTVNHLSDKDGELSRNILVEAARIARGKIKPLSQLRVTENEAMVFAGGFGVAKNFCNFAFVGSDAILQTEVAAIIGAFVEEKKPVGALCIAPVLLALTMRDRGITGARITLGDGEHAEAIATVQGWGCQHQTCAVNEACVDAQHLFVTSPAYMISEASPADIFSSAQALVSGLIQLLGK